MQVDEFRDRRSDRLNATEDHRSTADGLLAFYQQKGLLPDGQDEALFRCCQHRDSCWTGADQPQNATVAGIAFPWIGADYFDARVLVVGINFHDYGGLDGNYQICLGHMEEMRNGKPGKAGLPFARGAMRYLNAVLASLEEKRLPEVGTKVANETLAESWEHCAFLELVKCSPAGRRSKPTDAMLWNCPRFLMKQEIRILAPRVILQLGRSSYPSALKGDAGGEHGPHLDRDSETIDGQEITVISLNHPSGFAHNVAASFKELVASLEKNPLG